mgnify:CR=1 FL=1
MKATIMNKRPVYLNLLKIHLPIGGILSIAHRISGFFLFLLIPLWIYLLDLSLQNEQGFSDVKQLLDGWFFKLVVIACIWALIHHFLAGIRHLLLDMDIGIEKQAATKSAWIVFIVEAVLVLIMIGVIL